MSALPHQEKNRTMRKAAILMSLLSSSPTDPTMAAVNTRCRTLPCCIEVLIKYVKLSIPVTRQEWSSQMTC